MKSLIGLIVVAGLLLMSCAQTLPPSGETPPEESPVVATLEPPPEEASPVVVTPEPLPEEAPPVVVTPEPPPEESSSVVATPEPPPEETPPEEPPAGETPEPPPELYHKTWISSGKVNVGNFYPGARAECILTIHNGNDESAEFSVTYRQPGSVGEGYVTAPDEAQDWVIIADPTPVLEAKETKDVLIAVEMPEDAEAPPKWEFWVAVKDTTQTEMVQTELAYRWLVTMK